LVFTIINNNEKRDDKVRHIFPNFEKNIGIKELD